jgi:hypothetical protein
VPPRLPRYYRYQQQQEDARKLADILAQPVDDTTTARHGATLAGDKQRLRGLPAVSRGVSGTQPGTQPLAALLAKERRARRH